MTTTIKASDHEWAGDQMPTRRSDGVSVANTDEKSVTLPPQSLRHPMKHAGDVKLKRGRPVTYDKATLAPDLLKWLRTGEPMAAWCDKDGHPSDDTIERWEAEDPEFAREYARAKEIGYDAVADRMRKIAADIEIPVDRARLMTDVDKWLLARRSRRYNDKLAVEHSGGLTLEQIIGKSMEPPEPKVTP